MRRRAGRTSSRRGPAGALRQGSGRPIRPSRSPRAGPGCRWRRRPRSPSSRSASGSSPGGPSEEPAPARSARRRRGLAGQGRDRAAGRHRLSWPPHPGAATYRVQVFASDGARVWRSEVREPRLSIDAGVLPSPRPGQSFVIEVEALDSMGQVIAAGDAVPLAATVDERQEPCQPVPRRSRDSLGPPQRRRRLRRHRRRESGARLRGREGRNPAGRHPGLLGAAAESAGEPGIRERLLPFAVRRPGGLHRPGPPREDADARSAAGGQEDLDFDPRSIHGSSRPGPRSPRSGFRATKRARSVIEKGDLAKGVGRVAGSRRRSVGGESARRRRVALDARGHEAVGGQAGRCGDRRDRPGPGRSAVRWAGPTSRRSSGATRSKCCARPTATRTGRTPPARPSSIRERLAPDSLAVSYCLHELSSVMQDEDPEYEAINQRALAIRQKLAPGSRNEAASLINLSNFANTHGDSRAGIDLVLRALAINQRSGPVEPNRREELLNLCWHQMDRGEIAAAEEYCQRSLELWRRSDPASVTGSGRLFTTWASSRGCAATSTAPCSSSFRNARSSTRSRPAGPRMLERLRARGDRAGTCEPGQGGRAPPPLRGARSARSPPVRPMRALLALMRANIAYQRKDLAERGEASPAGARLLRTRRPRPVRPPQPSSTTWPVFSESAASTARPKTSSDARSHSGASTAPGARRRRSRATTSGCFSGRPAAWPRPRSSSAARSTISRPSRASSAAPRNRCRSSEAEFADYYKDYLGLLMELRREQDAFLILERFRAGAFLRTLAQRDLAVPDGILADLERERSATNVEYERTQGEIRTLNPPTTAKEIDEALARLAGVAAEAGRRSPSGSRRPRRSTRRCGIRDPWASPALGRRSIRERSSCPTPSARRRAYLFVVSADPERGRSAVGLHAAGRREGAARVRRGVPPADPAEQAAAGASRAEPVALRRAA